MKKTLVLSIIFCFFVLNYATAFDNQRGGFIIGGIGGITTIHWHQVAHNGTRITIYDKWDFGLHTDFRLGGVSHGNRAMYFWWNAFNLFFADNYMPSVYGNKALVISGVSGFGFAFYLNPTSPSLYFNVGAGPAMWHTPDKDVQMPWIGVGAMGGIGYEFARHWSIELGISVSHVFHNAEDYGYVSPMVSALECTPIPISLSIIGLAY